MNQGASVSIQTAENAAMKDRSLDIFEQRRIVRRKVSRLFTAAVRKVLEMVEKCEVSHGSPDNPDHRDDYGRRYGDRRILATNTED